MSDSSKRHCWECLRRCLVCDSTRPACNRCTAAGSSCPGYDDVKPTRLRWLAPGKVSSRVRRRKCSAEPSELGCHGQSLATDTSATVSALHTDNTSIPRFSMDPDTDAVVHAAEYCKFILNPADADAVTNWARQLTSAFIKISSPSKSLETTPTSIRYHPLSSGEGLRVPITYGSGWCAWRSVTG